MWEPQQGAGAMPVTLVGVCVDANSSFMRGASTAPPIIRAALASPSANLSLEDGREIGVDLHYEDGGDLDVVNGPGAIPAIEAAAAALAARGRRILALGGDHSVTAPLVRACPRAGAGLTILHVDAHPDLYDRFDGGLHSHASPFARIMEERLARRLVQVGIRTANRHQREQAARFGVELIEMRELARLQDLQLDGELYLSIDLDALDPAFAPGVSHHEPGGLTTRELLSIVQAIDAPVVGADIVELNPSRDLSGVTAMAAAKIVKEVLGTMLRGS